MPAYCIYLGEHNNKKYVINKNGGIIYEYDLNTNTIVSDALYKIGTICYATLWNGRIVVSSTTNIYILKFDTDDTIKLESSFTGSNIHTRSITGTNHGDYMFTSTTKSTHATNTISSVGYLKCYKISIQAKTGEYIYIEDTPLIFEKFTTQACMINYNPRNGLLTIGTVDGIYLYQYNISNKTFTEIPLDIELPEKIETTMYLGCASPDGSEILIATLNSTGFSTKICLTGYNTTVALLDEIENIGPKNYTAIVSNKSAPRQTLEATAEIPYTANITFNVSPSANNLILIEGEN